MSGLADALAQVKQVQVYGGRDNGYFGLALDDLVTPSGHSFSASPIDWPIPPGTGGWFGQKLQDGISFAFGSMTLTDSEAKPTMLQTTLFIWNDRAKRLQTIPVPTTTGVLNPPNIASTASGATIDMLRPVTIAGVNYIFAVNAVGYTGWQIATYGEPYHLMAFKETAGTWAFDPTHSVTAHALASSSSAGATAFATSTNTFGETIYNSLGPVCMVLTPQSNHLILGNYFYRSGHNSGSFVAIDPATGVVKGFFEYPDITDTSSVPVTLSVRDIIANPTSAASDERFVMTPDVFIRAVGSPTTIGTPGPPSSGTFVPGNEVIDSNGVAWFCTVGGTPGTFQKGSNYGLSPLMEMKYDGTGTITLVSTPMLPFTMPGQSYLNDYNLVQFTDEGDLFCPTHGGVGLGVFHGREGHLFRADGSQHLPTFENGGPASNWQTTQFPTQTKADLRIGSFAISQGFDCSLNYDATRNRMLMLGIGGEVVGASFDGTTVGPEMAVNGGITSGTTGWNGFFNSTLAQVADASFASGQCLELTSTTGTANVASQAVVPVEQFRNYTLTCKVKGVTVAQSVTADMWWHDENGALISATSSPTVIESGATTVMTIECLASAPAGAVSGFLLIDITASTVGEQHKIGDVSWKSVPALGTPTIDTNKARVINGAETFPNKGDIVGDRLLFTTISLDPTIPPNVGESLPQWLTSVDLGAFAGPATTPPPIPPKVWRLVLKQTDSTPIGELTAAAGKTITWPLDDVPTVAFTIDGMHPQAALVEEVTTDLVVYDQNGRGWFRGRMGTSSDAIDPVSGHVSTFSAVGYRGMFQRRSLRTSVSGGIATAAFTAVDQGLIAYQLIADSENQPGGNPLVTAGTGLATGVLRTITFAELAKISDLIDGQLANLDSGFEYEIDADLAFNVFYPQRGAMTSVVLEYPGNVVSVPTRSIDTSTFANLEAETGATTVTTPVIVQAATIGPAGLWESVTGDTSILDQTTLTAKAAADLTNAEVLTPSHVLVLRDGWWTPEQLWLGDTALVVVNSGRVHDLAFERVTQVQVVIGDDGGQVVTITTGALPQTDTVAIRQALYRINKLETL